MRKQYQNIFSMMLLFAGIVIFAHSIIPHDHHFDMNIEAEHQQEQHENHDSPLHCHFLNDIVFDKVVISFNQTVVKNIPALNAILFSLNNSDEQAANHYLSIIKSDNLPDYQVFLAHSPTRGSPKLLA